MSLLHRFEDAVAVAVAASIEGLPSDTTHLAAVSGGADSVAMLVALAALRESSRDFDLRCIHVNHGIRPDCESRGDADFVRRLCGRLRVPCRVVSVRPGKVAETAVKRGIGIEAAARLYRHRAWNREAGRLESTGSGRVRILVAHTEDDMLETVLMRMLRGSGPSGLAAMPSNRGRILRPLLALTRRDVLSYLADVKASWREDATNTDTRYLRNRIRHRLIPLLSDDFPNWRAAVSSVAQTQSLAADFIVGEAKLRVRWNPKPGGIGDSLFTDEAGFFALHPIIREEALFQGIDLLLAGSGEAGIFAGGIRRANIRHFSRGMATAVDLGRALLRRKTGSVIISRRRKGSGRDSASERGFALVVEKPGSYRLKGITLDVGECPPVGGCPPADAGKATFSAVLPVVFRLSIKEDRIGRTKGDGKLISAVDSLGIAAFIGNGGLIAGRNDVPCGDLRVCTVEVGAGNR